MAFGLEVQRKHCLSPGGLFYPKLACCKSQFVSPENRWAKAASWLELRTLRAPANLRAPATFAGLPTRWGDALRAHPCEFFRRGRPGRAWRIARCRARGSTARWSIL